MLAHDKLKNRKVAIKFINFGNKSVITRLNNQYYEINQHIKVVRSPEYHKAI